MGEKEPKPGAVSRRGFIASVGAGAVGAAVLPAAAGAAAASPGIDEDGTLVVRLRVNGRTHAQRVEPRWSLLYVLRERLGLTGSKPGCERGECGACTVLIDGVARYACMTLAVEADGHEITTVEGLMSGEELGPVQRAFVEEDGMQCGYCTPGQVMAAEALLRATPDPTDHQVRHAMSGNLCRCGAYPNIARAVKRAAVLRRTGGGS